jgi:hypothetical protein
MADSDTAGTDFESATNDGDQPTGSSTVRDSTGVDPQQAIDDHAPRLQSGGQGG